MTAPSDIVAKLNTFFASSNAPKDMLARLGFKRTLSYDADGHQVRNEFEVEPGHCHTGGTIAQGGFVAGWLDNAMATSIFAATDFALQPISLDLTVSYISSAGPGTVYADAWILRLGKSVAFVEAQLVDPTEKLLAKASSTLTLRAF